LSNDFVLAHPRWQRLRGGLGHRLGRSES
jgi:hypothetical protein